MKRSLIAIALLAIIAASAVIYLVQEAEDASASAFVRARMRETIAVDRATQTAQAGARETTKAESTQQAAPTSTYTPTPGATDTPVPTSTPTPTPGATETPQPTATDTAVPPTDTPAHASPTQEVALTAESNGYIWVTFSNDSDGLLEVWAEAPFVVNPGEMGIIFYSSKILNLEGIGTGAGYDLLGQNRFDSTGVTQPGEKIRFLDVEPRPSRWWSEERLRAAAHFLHTNITNVMAIHEETEENYLCERYESTAEKSRFVCTLCEMSPIQCLGHYQADWY